MPPGLAADPGDPSYGDDLHLGTYTYLMSVPKPVIAAINGPVAGMGVPIVLACDLRFMAEDAVLMTAFAQRGLIAEWGISWLLPRLTGTAVALDLLFSSRKVSGTEAAALRVVNAALPREEVLAARPAVRPRPGGDLVTGLHGHHEAAGLPAAARRAARGRARGPAADGRELQPPGFPGGRGVVHRAPGAGVRRLAREHAGS